MVNEVSGDVVGDRHWLMARTFARHDIADIRHMLARHATDQGLSGMRHHDFVLAVHEVVVNVISHGGGSGLMRLWQADGMLCCQISDDGPGIPARRLHRSHAPGHDGEDGRGLWLIWQLGDAVTFSSDADGTTVRISVRLSG